MQRLGHEYIACRPPPPPTLGIGSIGQKSIISEHGHGAYQFKGNQECSNLVADILPAEKWDLCM